MLDTIEKEEGFSIPPESEKQLKDIVGQTRGSVLFVNLEARGIVDSKRFCDDFGFNFLSTNNHEDHLNADFVVFGGSQIPSNFIIALSMLYEKQIISNEWIRDSLKEGKVGDYTNFQVEYDNSTRKSKS